MKGFEPLRLLALVPKTNAAAFTPHPHLQGALGVLVGQIDYKRMAVIIFKIAVCAFSGNDRT